MSGFVNNKIEEKSIDCDRVVFNSDNARVYSNSVMNLNETEAIDIDNMGSAPELYIKSDDWMFGEKDANKGQFGGNQGALTYNASIWLKDKKVRKIVDKYYPDATEEDLELLFFRMNTCGCGYVAVINTIMQATHGMDDYQEKFGFQQYTLGFEDSGEPYIDYNYEYLFLDYFLYFAKNNEGYETIEEVYGNAAEEREYRSSDAALDNQKFPQIGMNGIGPSGHVSLVEKYLNEKGIEFKREDSIEIEQGSADWNKKRAYLESKGLTIDDDEHLYYRGDELTREMIDDIINSGKFLNVGSAGFDLYYPYDKDGNGKLDDVCASDVGEHAMFVVGTTSDPTKVVVSSWGGEYVMDISDLREYTIFTVHV